MVWTCHCVFGGCWFFGGIFGVGTFDFHYKMEKWPNVQESLLEIKQLWG